MGEARANLVGISLNKKLEKKGGAGKIWRQGHIWQQLEAQGSVQEVGLLPESGVGWESNPLSRNTESRVDLPGTSSWLSVSLPTLLLSPTQMNEHTCTLSPFLMLYAIVFFSSTKVLAAVTITAKRLVSSILCLP